jgi:hypothetical protein
MEEFRIRGIDKKSGRNVVGKCNPVHDHLDQESRREKARADVKSDVYRQ